MNVQCKMTSHSKLYRVSHGGRSSKLSHAYAQPGLLLKPGYYKVTDLIEPNVIEVDGTWFIKLKGVNENVPKKELSKWLKENNIVRVVPYGPPAEDARIISDVWLGNVHINRQFSGYDEKC